MAGIAENLQRVRDKIGEAAEKSGRSARDVQLIAVTKKVDIPQVEEALACGVTDIGENRVQEFTRKYRILADRVSWHLIGHLQTNKVKYMIDKAELIHSLDRLPLAEELQKRAATAGRKVNVLVQVNISGEESKFGLPAGAARDFIARIVDEYPALEVQGLMTMAPFLGDQEKVRPVFKGLRKLFEEIKAEMPLASMRFLSMGMTNDYQVAIEEGANLVRIGTAIFGERET